MTDYTDEKHDLWYQARQSHIPNRLLEIGKGVIQSLPGMPAREKFINASPAILGAGDHWSFNRIPYFVTDL